MGCSWVSDEDEVEREDEFIYYLFIYFKWKSGTEVTAFTYLIERTFLKFVLEVEGSNWWC